jgi:hypothetical protein
LGMGEHPNCLIVYVGLNLINQARGFAVCTHDEKGCVQNIRRKGRGKLFIGVRTLEQAWVCKIKIFWLP